MRVPQPFGTIGSLKWLQRAVRHRPDLLQPDVLPPIHWVSPLIEDDLAEYRDGAFLERVGLAHLAVPLHEFWPRRGPQWDALGLSERGPVLVEAKAHLGEFFSSPCAASPASRARIDAAFGAVRADLGVSRGADWAELFYQYANRLAHLWWLRRQGVDAELVFVSFLNDADLGGPASREVWDTAFAVADHALGLPTGHRLRSHIHHLSPDVAALHLPATEAAKSA